MNSHTDQFATPEILQQNRELGDIVLTAAVLSILLTAPLFGALMSWWGYAKLDRVEATSSLNSSYGKDAQLDAPLLSSVPEEDALDRRSSAARYEAHNAL